MNWEETAGHLPCTFVPMPLETETEKIRMQEGVVEKENYRKYRIGHFFLITSLPRQNCWRGLITDNRMKGEPQTTAILITPLPPPHHHVASALFLSCLTMRVLSSVQSGTWAWGTTHFDAYVPGGVIKWGVNPGAQCAWTTHGTTEASEDIRYARVKMEFLTQGDAWRVASEGTWL
jgi:hypothetical protein